MPMKKHEFDKRLSQWLREGQATVARVVRFLREDPETVYSGEELEKRFGRFIAFDYRPHLRDAVVQVMDGMPYFHSPRAALNPHLTVGTRVEHDFCTYEHGPERCAVLGKQGVVTRVVEPNLDEPVFEHQYEVRFGTITLTLKSNNLRIVPEGEGGSG